MSTAAWRRTPSGWTLNAGKLTMIVVGGERPIVVEIRFAGRQIPAPSDDFGTEDAAKEWCEAYAEELRVALRCALGLTE